MNLVQALPLVFDPNHESPDVIDQRAPTDPTRAQTGGAVPVLVSPGDTLPVLDGSEPLAPIIPGWNVWDVFQAQAPIDPLPGSLDQQLATWVRTVAELPDDQPIAVVSNAAAGQVLVTRSSFPTLAGPPLLGASDSAVVKRTIAFENAGPRLTVAWPHDMNTILDAVYIPAPALPNQPSTPPAGGPVPAPAATSNNADGGDESAVVLLGLGVGLCALLLMRGRGRRW